MRKRGLMCLPVWPLQHSARPAGICNVSINLRMSFVCSSSDRKRGLFVSLSITLDALTYIIMSLSFTKPTSNLPIKQSLCDDTLVSSSVCRCFFLAPSAPVITTMQESTMFIFKGWWQHILMMPEPPKGEKKTSHLQLQSARDELLQMRILTYQKHHLCMCMQVCKD